MGSTTNSLDSNHHHHHHQHDSVSFRPCCCCCTSAEDHVKLLEDVVERVVGRMVVPLLQPQGSSSLPSRLAINQAEPTCHPNFQLYIEGELPKRLYTGKKIQEQGASLTVYLRDPSSGRIVGHGPLSSVKVKIVVLPGEFKAEDGGCWTEKEFNENILQERKGKRPLLVGTCEFALRNGVASIGDFEVTDNSSWTRDGEFRIAIMVAGGQCPGVRVVEAVSDAFKVKERRLQSSEKHDPPYLEDYVWRLHHIAKNGQIHKRLAENKVNTVKDFLQLYYTDQLLLDKILGVSKKARLEIIEQATSCVLPHELYTCYNSEIGIKVWLNCVLDVLGVTFNGQHYHSLESLDDFVKEKVEELRRHAYKNPAQLLRISDQTLQMALPSAGIYVNQQPPGPALPDPGAFGMEEQSFSPFQTPHSCQDLVETQFSYQLLQEPLHLTQTAVLPIGINEQRDPWVRTNIHNSFIETLSPPLHLPSEAIDDRVIFLRSIAPNLPQMSPIRTALSKSKWVKIRVLIYLRRWRTLTRAARKRPRYV